MQTRRLFRCLLLTFAALVTSVPSQAAMVATAQVQNNPIAIDAGGISTQRNWIRAQLVLAGVEAVDASRRVAALTDAQVTQLHQRIDEAPAGGNMLVIVILLLVITELMGFTDIVPSWP
jgi:hypothetical protein